MACRTAHRGVEVGVVGAGPGDPLVVDQPELVVAGPVPLLELELQVILAKGVEVSGDRVVADHLVSAWPPFTNSSPLLAGQLLGHAVAVRTFDDLHEPEHEIIGERQAQESHGRAHEPPTELPGDVQRVHDVGPAPRLTKRVGRPAHDVREIGCFDVVDRG